MCRHRQEEASSNLQVLEPYDAQSQTAVLVLLVSSTTREMVIYEVVAVRYVSHDCLIGTPVFNTCSIVPLRDREGRITHYVGMHTFQSFAEDNDSAESAQQKSSLLLKSRSVVFIY